jgi:hypothetical protein
MHLDIALAWLRVKRQLGPRDASQARAFFASLHPANAFLHHREGQEAVYAYPHVQFKSLGRSLLVVGLQEGADFVERNCQVSALTLGGRRLKVWQCPVRRFQAYFGPTDDHVLYHFLTPWLALNRDNYRSYKRIEDLEGRMQLLGRVLVSNLLSIGKTLGILVEGRLHANVVLDDVPASLKGEQMTGFIGNFSVNLDIPDYVGIGKGAARGFGTVRRR